jgi:ribonuclease R
MVHRLLDHYLKGGKPVKAEEYEAQSKHCTDMEIRASEAERSSIKFKQAQYLMGREGEAFDGVISGVTEWGIYVELVESKCEGLIRIRDLKDDFYELDEKNYCLVGNRTRRKFQLGDAVSVQLKSADLLKKQIDFVIAGELVPAGFERNEGRASNFGRRSDKPSKSAGKKSKGFGSSKQKNKKRR